MSILLLSRAIPDWCGSVPQWKYLNWRCEHVRIEAHILYSTLMKVKYTDMKIWVHYGTIKIQYSLNLSKTYCSKNTPLGLSNEWITLWLPVASLPQGDRRAPSCRRI
jgi:hypothetical protein